MFKRQLGMLLNLKVETKVDDNGNDTFVIFGGSGKGKTSKKIQICQTLSREGAITILFNGEDRLNKDRIPEIYEGGMMNDVAEVCITPDNSLEFPLLSYVDEDSKTVDLELTKSKLMIAINDVFKPKKDEVETLKTAISIFVEEGYYETQGLSGLGNVIHNLNDKNKDSLYKLLEPLFEVCLMKNGRFPFEAGKVNMISFKGVSSESQRKFLFLMIAMLAQMSKDGEFIDTPVYTCVDDIENLKKPEEEILNEVLERGRSGKLFLIYVGHYLDNKKSKLASNLMSAGTILAFNPGGDCGPALRLLGERTTSSLSNNLKFLKRGEFILKNDEIFLEERAYGKKVIKVNAFELANQTD